MALFLCPHLLCAGCPSPPPPTQPHCRQIQSQDPTSCPRHPLALRSMQWGATTMQETMVRHMAGMRQDNGAGQLLWQGTNSVKDSHPGCSYAPPAQLFVARLTMT